MENLAHTLFGLTLAKAGFERATPLATSALVISSNLPDLDVFASAGRGTLGYLKYHRGFTHSFVGAALLATGLTLLLMLLDRRFRLRRDFRRRPLRPLRVFAIAYLGMLGHIFMDFTNAYGVRPLLPFSGRWFYGDLVFVADPWIWLALGSSAVWLTTFDPERSFFLPRLFIWLRLIFWLAAATATALLVAMAMHDSTPLQPAIPVTTRLIWFAGFVIIITGVVRGWGRAGPALARYSLLALGIYYAGMWMAHQSALKQAWESQPAESVAQFSAWPTAANPMLWQAAASSDESAFTRLVRLRGDEGEWLKQPLLDREVAGALARSADARMLLDFMRYGTATIREHPEGYTVTLRDLRFSLRGRVELDRDLNVLSTEAGW